MQPSGAILTIHLSGAGFISLINLLINCRPWLISLIKLNFMYPEFRIYLFLWHFPEVLFKVILI